MERVSRRSLGSLGNRWIVALILTLAVLSTGLAGPGPKDIPCIWSGVDKILVIGDLHGDYDNFEKIIRGTGLVDSDLHWSAGPTHLVQTGDIMDRGPDARKILDALIRLEAEAGAVGGLVHVLLGNHEELNIGGVIFRYPDYVPVEQFISFLPDGYRQRQERELEKRVRRVRGSGVRVPVKNIADEFWSSLKNDPEAQREYLVNFNNKYGDWLLRRNIAIKIDDTVFVHGGISEKYSLWGIQKLNDRFRLEMTALQRATVYDEPVAPPQLEIVYRGDSPLWYRELATNPEQDMREEVDAILANLGAKHMVIAHTPRTAVTLSQMKRFEGRIWIVDTGISKAYNNNLSALKIINGEFIVWGGDHEEKDNAGIPGRVSAFSRLGLRLLPSAG